MQYMALIYGPEAAEPDAEMFQAYGKFAREMLAKGVLKHGDALQPASTATCVTVRGGATQLKDGPFTETKEQLGGYYILECDSLDEAIACAEKIPGAAIGTIEIRPVLTP